MDDALRSMLSLQALSKGTLARHDDALRQIVFDMIVAPNMSTLRGGNARRWNEAGWYSPIADQQATAPLSEPFPIPDGCHGWKSPEYHAQRDELFRFFARNAWLDLPVADGVAVLSFVVVYVVMNAALDSLRLSVNGMPVVHAVEACPHAHAKVSIALTGEMLDHAKRAGFLRLDLHSPVEAIPALIHPGSADRRHLSMAICYPRFEGPQAPVQQD
jgi:hypothetical protein